MKRFLLFLFAVVLFASCAPKPTSDVDEAQNTLVDFLTMLNTKQYVDAAPLYGGSYEQLQVFNPKIDPSDHVALWTWVCENELLQCLPVRTVTFKERQSDTFFFQVEFNNLDGSLFVLGPCCGANETEMPPVSQFEYAVTRNPEGNFLVMNEPPYVP